MTETENIRIEHLGTGSWIGRIIRYRDHQYSDGRLVYSVVASTCKCEDEILDHCRFGFIQT